VPGALALLATPARQIEAEGGRAVFPLPRERLGREQLADFVERLDVGDRVRPRRAPDRRLIDQHRILEQLPAGERGHRAYRLAQMRLGGVLAAQLALEIPVDHVVEQRALARAAHARDGGERAERNVHVHPAEVVQLGPAHPEPERSGGPAKAGDGDPLLAGEILAGERLRRLGHRSGVHHPAAALARARAELEHEVGLLHRGEIVLHHHHRVPGVAQPAEQGQQAIGVARMEPDGRLVEHVERVYQAGPQRVGERDPLRLASGEGAGLPVETEVAEADVAEEAEAGVELVHDEVGDFALERR
jgi:hypothetical protein